jgi:glycosyltransferase involved in cell wall biosynthesis
VLDSITPVILTFNEAPNIERQLATLDWARELLVIDSGSTDATLEILARHPRVRVLHRPFDSFAGQWAHALEQGQIATEWFLRLDADYLMTEALRDELAALALLVTLALTLRSGLLPDILFGLAWAFALPLLARLRNPGGLYGRASFWLSEISFTLYVVHFPFAFLLWLALFAPAQYALGLPGLAIWLGLLTATLAYAIGMWWLFERNTGRVRAAAQRLFRTTETRI